MRTLPSESSWLKRTVLRWTAEYSFTGTFTRPNEIAPVQIDRGIGDHVTPFHPKPLLTARIVARSHTRHGRPSRVGSFAYASAPPRYTAPPPRHGPLLSGPA